MKEAKHLQPPQARLAPSRQGGAGGPGGREDVASAMGHQRGHVLNVPSHQSPPPGWYGVRVLGHPSTKEPCPSSPPASSTAPGGSRGWKHGAALSGGMKQPFGTKSAGIHEISWQLSTGRDSTHSPTGRDRARTGQQNQPAGPWAAPLTLGRGLPPSPLGRGS